MIDFCEWINTWYGATIIIIFSICFGILMGYCFGRKEEEEQEVKKMLEILLNGYFILSMAFITTLYVCYTMINRTIKVLRLHKS